VNRIGFLILFSLLCGLLCLELAYFFGFFDKPVDYLKGWVCNSDNICSPGWQQVNSNVKGSIHTVGCCMSLDKKPSN